MNRTNTIPSIGLMSLLAFASCDQSPSPTSAADTATPPVVAVSTPSPEAILKAAHARESAAKSQKLGQDAGSHDVIPIIGNAMFLKQQPEVPTQSEFDDLIEKATTKATNSDPDIDVNAFRTGYITGFKLGFKFYEDAHRPAF